MGGHGASSGGRRAKDGTYLPYGSEYKTVYQADNIKFVSPTDGKVKAPLETMTQNRIYVTIGSDGNPRYVSFYDSENRKMKQIDMAGKAHRIDGEMVLPHTHKGYYHDENGTDRPTKSEQELVDRIRKLWYNRHSKK